MASLVDLSGAQHGVEADETGINIDTYEVSSEPEFTDILADKVGEARGFASGAVKAMITISGEVFGSTGVMAVVPTTAFVPANDVDQFGQTAGGCYPRTFVQSQSRTGFRKVTVTLERLKAVT
jgi:hypothetical protein